MRENQLDRMESVFPSLTAQFLTRTEVGKQFENKQFQRLTEKANMVKKTRCSEMNVLSPGLKVAVRLFSASHVYPDALFV